MTTQQLQSSATRAEGLLRQVHKCETLAYQLQSLYERKPSKLHNDRDTARNNSNIFNSTWGLNQHRALMIRVGFRGTSCDIYIGSRILGLVRPKPL